MFSCCKGKRRERGDATAKPPCPSPTEMFDSLCIKATLEDCDKKLIKQTGSMFQEIDLIEKGVPFLILFFKTYPSHLRYFKAFKSLTADELNSLPVTKNHGRRVLEQMVNIVECVDKPIKLKELVQELSYSHRVRRVKSKQFKDMLILFIQFVKGEMGPKFTAQHENAWNKLIAVILELLHEEETRISRSSDPAINVQPSSPDDTESSVHDNSDPAH